MATTRQTTKQPKKVSTVVTQGAGQVSVDAETKPAVREIRQSEPKNYTPYARGGVGIVARRTTFDPFFGNSSQKLENFATTQPMRLLSLLPSIHPSVGFALWSALRLMFPEDGVTVRCYKSSKKKKVTSTNKKIDEAASAEIEELCDRLPQELGGLNGLCTTGAIQLLFSGMTCLEAVIGEPLEGLDAIWPVDSLSITFVRPGRNESLQAWQKQIFPQWANGNKQLTQQTPLKAAYDKIGNTDDALQRAMQAGILGTQYVQMPSNTFFWHSIDSDVDDPYGMAPYATCLSEVLADLVLMQDLRDAVHNAAWPRTHFGINLSELHRVAVEIHKITDAKAAAQWVMDRFNEARELAASLGSDENLVSDSNGDVKILQPGSFQGLDNVLTFLRQRIVQSLKTLPTLMGIMDTSNVNVQSVEYGIYAAGLETLRHLVMSPIIKAFNLHLRTKGINAEAIAEYLPIRGNDALVEGNTLSIKLQNAMNAEKMGFMDHNEASIYVVGHIAVAEAKDGVLDTPIGQSSFGEQQGKSGPKTAGGAGGGGVVDTGKSKEDKSTKNGGGGSN